MTMEMIMERIMVMIMKKNLLNPQKRSKKKMVTMKLKRRKSKKSRKKPQEIAQVQEGTFCALCVLKNSKLQKN